MAFTLKDRQEVDQLTEEFLCSNLSIWLDLDQIVEAAFEVQRIRKNNAKKAELENKQKQIRRTRKKQ